MFILIYSSVVVALKPLVVQQIANTLNALTPIPSSRPTNCVTTGFVPYVKSQHNLSSLGSMGL